MSVEANVHLRAAIFVITGLRIGHLITGYDQGTLELHGRATFLAELRFRSRRAAHRTRPQGGTQICRLAENALGFGSVLYARQFDHDAVGPGAAPAARRRQLVDAVAHGGQVLLDRIFADLSQLGLGQRQTQHELAVALAGGQLEIGEVLANQRLSGAESFLIGEAQLHGILQIRQAAIAHALLAQQALTSPSETFSRVSMAFSISTSSRKCTPPERSRPSFMGLAPRLRSQSGVVVQG